MWKWVRRLDHLVFLSGAVVLYAATWTAIRVIKQYGRLTSRIPDERD